MKTSMIFFLNRTSLGWFFTVVFLCFSCQKKDLRYPVNLVVLGPYDNDQYQSLRDLLWLKKPIDLNKRGEVFFIAEVYNFSSDTVSIGTFETLGDIWLYDLCFKNIEDGCLLPKPAGGIIEAFKKWDTLMPNSLKRYLYLPNYEFNECDLVELSLDVKSVFFDSLNQKKAIRYYLKGSAVFERNHPVFLFEVKNGSLVRVTDVDIQKELNRAVRKLRKLKRSVFVQ